MSYGYEQVREVAIDILENHLGLTEVRLESTLDSLQIDSLSMFEFMTEFECRLDARTHPTVRVRGDQSLRDLIDLLCKDLDSKGVDA